MQWELIVLEESVNKVPCAFQCSAVFLKRHRIEYINFARVIHDCI